MNIKKDIAALLDRPHFHTSADTKDLPPDPTIPTRIKVTVDRLVPYSGNPRLSKNPHHFEIKESIRNRGLDHPFNITRESPDKPYMIKDGGNTRLAILNELWQETQDRRFYELECLFSPWTSDFEIYVGHIIENDLRSPFSFIERAIAATKIKTELEAIEQKTLSLRELETQIHSIGWTTVDFTNLGQLLYAHEALFPIIPNAFRAGTGRDAVKRIRKILESARTFWESVATPDEGSFDDIWQAVFKELDKGEFNISNAQYLLEAEIAQRLQSPMTSVSGEIQAISEGLSPGGVRPINVLTPLDSSDNNSSSKTANGKPESRKELPPTSATTVNDNNNIDDAAEVIEQPTQPPSTEQVSENPLHHLISYSTEELMDHAIDLALDYASHYGFEGCVDLPDEYDFNGREGFHSGFVMFPPNKELEKSVFMNPNVIVNYMYLFQLSSWCWLDNDAPGMNLVSINNPLSWISEEYVDSASKSVMHMRALLAAKHLQDDPAGQVYSVMEELEATIGLIISRFSAHIGQGV